MTSQQKEIPMTSVPLSMNSLPVSEKENSHSSSTNLWDVLQYSIPKNLRRKAESLFTFLTSRGGDLIRWNNSGNLIYKGDLISDSNIIDLIRDALFVKSSHSPVGQRQFYEALKEIQVPISFVVNKNRLHVTDRQKGKGLGVKRRTNGAPPGFHKSRKNTNSKWIKF